MSSLFNLLRENPAYLEISTDGLKKEINVYHIDYTRGETDSCRLLLLRKENLSRDAAFIILIQRLLMIEEEWTDYENYNPEDLMRWSGLVASDYRNSHYEDNVVLDTDEDNSLFMKRLMKESPQNIFYNNSEIAYESYRRNCPLFNEQFLKVSKSKFNWLQVEFYIETPNYYMLYNWYTTA
ncbi:MAG: hypothetical protein ACO1N0_10090 [Fluviicola sp.]